MSQVWEQRSSDSLTVTPTSRSHFLLQLGPTISLSRYCLGAFELLFAAIHKCASSAKVYSLHSVS